MTKWTTKKLSMPLLALEEKLAAIGIMLSSKNLSARAVASVDIEDALADAIISLLHTGVSSRLFGPLLSWTSEHGSAVIIEKLVKILHRRNVEGSDVSYAALLGKFALSKGHKRWSTVVEKFATNLRAPRIVDPVDMVESLLSLRGEEEWAQGSGFRVPKGAAGTHVKWTLSRQALAQQNHQYRNRLIYGAQWRADIITAYERGAQTPAVASRMSGASYEPCYRVKEELEAAGLLKSS